MGLSVLACVGSLLGWQFTIAQTGKDAAEMKMFPQFFTKINKMGAPITGMLVLGVVQTVLALSTISPSLSEQFGVLVNLAVVTNVVPYVIALSAIIVMMKSAGVDKSTYTRNVAISLVAMLYSVFALYASGKDAVMGGMLVMGVAYIAWGFLAPRFSGKMAKAAVAAAMALLLLGTLATPARAQHAAPAQHAAAQPAMAAPSPTLERIRRAGKITLGYRADARPYSFREGSGAPDGFTVALCQQVVEAVKTELGLSTLSVNWVPVTIADRFESVKAGRVDLLCGAESQTLARRAEVSFSIPVYPGGVAAVLRHDAPARLREILKGERQSTPSWRASAGQLLQEQTFTVVRGSSAQAWLVGKLHEFQLTARVQPVDDYGAAVQQLRERRASVLFGDQAILLDAINRTGGNDLVLLDRQFTREPVGLVLARNDDGFRLVVDRALSRYYAMPAFSTLYKQWFGEPEANRLVFYQWNALPD
jgi:putrescine:ornithine antiporter